MFRMGVFSFVLKLCAGDFFVTGNLAEVNKSYENRQENVGY